MSETSVLKHERDIKGRCYATGTTKSSASPASPASSRPWSNSPARPIPKTRRHCRRRRQNWSNRARQRGGRVRRFREGPAATRDSVSAAPCTEPRHRSLSFPAGYVLRSNRPLMDDGARQAPVQLLDRGLIHVQTDPAVTGMRNGQIYSGPVLLHPPTADGSDIYRRTWRRVGHGARRLHASACISQCYDKSLYLGRVQNDRRCVWKFKSGSRPARCRSGWSMR